MIHCTVLLVMLMIAFGSSKVEAGILNVIDFEAAGDGLTDDSQDGFMIEICNCDSLPVVPLAGEMARTCSRVNLQVLQQQQIQQQVVQQ